MTRRIPKSAAQQVECLFIAVAAELHRFACRLTQGDKLAGEDLVQDVFHDAAVAWDELGRRHVGHQRAWLFTALKNKAFSRWKVRARLDLKGDFEVTTSDHDDTHEKALNAIALQRCWQALKEMPPAQYRVAYLRWHEDWSTTEIAEFFGISSSTVRVHLRNARMDLTKAVGPDVQFIATPEVEEDGERRRHHD